MMNKKKKINFVIGLGKSGFWAAKFLKIIGKHVIVMENRKNKHIEKAKEELEKINIKVLLNTPFKFSEFSNLIDYIESIVLSPGIHLDNETVILLKEKGINIIGETSIGWNFLQDFKWVGITGTNGKSTVTHLLSHILEVNNLKAPPAGNIGIPICKYAHDYKLTKRKIDWIIAELSSYQIEIAKEIKPKIGIWTTFTPDHLERHKTIENYFNIKNNLLIQSEFRIYNYDDDYLRQSINSLNKGIWVTTKYDEEHIDNCDYWVNKDGYLIEQSKSLFNIKDFKLKGNHNLQNLLLATAAARKIGLKDIEIKTALQTYSQLPHRLETIYKTKNIEIINDSKATNFESSIAGINSIDGHPTIICGGLIKEGDSKSWVNVMKKKAHAIFLFGKSAYVLKSILRKGKYTKEIYCFRELSELILKVNIYAKNHDVKTILFSPSCSSFDQFKDFEARGNYFKELINIYFKNGN